MVYLKVIYYLFNTLTIYFSEKKKLAHSREVSFGINDTREISDANYDSTVSTQDGCNTQGNVSRILDYEHESTNTEDSGDDSDQERDYQMAGIQGNLVPNNEKIENTQDSSQNPNIQQSASPAPADQCKSIPSEPRTDLIDQYQYEYMESDANDNARSAQRKMKGGRCSGGKKRGKQNNTIDNYFFPNATDSKFAKQKKLGTSRRNSYSAITSMSHPEETPKPRERRSAEMTSRKQGKNTGNIQAQATVYYNTCDVKLSITDTPNTKMQKVKQLLGYQKPYVSDFDDCDTESLDNIDEASPRAVQETCDFTQTIVSEDVTTSHENNLPKENKLSRHSSQKRQESSVLKLSVSDEVLVTNANVKDVEPVYNNLSLVEKIRRGLRDAISPIKPITMTSIGDLDQDEETGKIISHTECSEDEEFKTPLLRRTNAKLPAEPKTKSNREKNKRSLTLAKSNQTRECLTSPQSKKDTTEDAMKTASEARGKRRKSQSDVENKFMLERVRRGRKSLPDAPISQSKNSEEFGSGISNMDELELVDKNLSLAPDCQTKSCVSHSSSNIVEKIRKGLRDAISPIKPIKMASVDDLDNDEDAEPSTSHIDSCDDEEFKTPLLPRTNATLPTEHNAKLNRKKSVSAKSKQTKGDLTTPQTAKSTIEETMKKASEAPRKRRKSQSDVEDNLVPERVKRVRKSLSGVSLSKSETQEIGVDICPNIGKKNKQGKHKAIKIQMVKPHIRDQKKALVEDNTNRVTGKPAFRFEN